MKPRRGTVFNSEREEVSGQRVMLFCLVVALYSSGALGQENNQPLRRNPVAIVLGKPILLEQLNPPEMEAKREKLGEAEFGRWLSEVRSRALVNHVYETLCEAYASQHGLLPTEAEIASELAQMMEAAKQHHPQADRDNPRLKEIGRQFVRARLLQGKVCRALHEKYGGRVGIGSLGACVPIEARKTFLQEQEKQGAFVVSDPEFVEVFWISVADERFADVVLTEREAREFFNRSPKKRQDDKGQQND